MLRPAVAFVLALAGAASLGAAAASCSDFKEGDTGTADAASGADGADGSDGARGAGDDAAASGGDDGGTSGGDAASAPDGTGPGPFGALPTGYCCTSDLQCRDRLCITFGLTRMCADRCTGDQTCSGATSGSFHCVGTTAAQDGHCEPTASPFQCFPANDFHYGTKQLGQCCAEMSDGRSGLDCIGGHCGTFGSGNPWICGNACANPSQCSNGFTCQAGDDYSICIPPTSDPYTCN